MKPKEMMKRKSRILFAFILVLIAQVNCQAPRREYPAEMPTPIYADIPDLLQRGEKHTFSVKTISEVECHAAISYYNLKDKWTTMYLPTIKSDQNGLCEWTWEIPEDAKDGLGGFRGYIQEEDKSTNIFPATFCIGKCP